MSVTAPLGSAASVNKDDQQIGRKGAESRARLMQATRELMASTPGQKITASAIARRAGLASQTFYLYFTDVQELLLGLCREVTDEAAALAAMLESPWPTDAPMAEAERFITAFYHFWDQHRPVLNVRKLLAGNGNIPFEDERNKASLPIVMKIAAQIAAAHADEALDQKDAVARSIIIFSAIERMAARYSQVTDAAGFDSADLRCAEAHILSLLLTRKG